VSDAIGQHLKAKAAQSAATSRGTGTVPKKRTTMGQAIRQLVTQRQAALAAEQTQKDAARANASTKGQPPRKRKPLTSGQVHAARAKAGFLDPSKIEHR
jgi:hypothetical protein